MRGYTTSDRIAYWLFKDRIPVVKLLIVSNIITLIAIKLFRAGPYLAWLVFDSRATREAPWTLFTYPLVASCCGVVSLLFACYWLWIAGGSLERSWGSRIFAWYFFLMCGISALGLWAGSFLTGAPASAVGLWYPLAGVTVAFAMANPEEQILFMFIIPMKLKYLALLDVVLVIISYGAGNPLLGIFALGGCAASYWYVRRGSSFTWRSGGQPDRVIRVRPRHAVRRSLNPIKRYREYRDRQRLRKLLGD